MDYVGLSKIVRHNGFEAFLKYINEKKRRHTCYEVRKVRTIPKKWTNDKKNPVFGSTIQFNRNVFGLAHRKENLRKTKETT